MRERFLLQPGLVFLNHGSFGACPAEVLQAQQAWQLEMEANPVEFLSRRSGALLNEARQSLAAFLGAQAEDLAFVPNATTGVNIVAHSLRLQAGDEVLVTDHEYGACDATWQQACQRSGAVYRRAAIPLPFQGEEFVDRVLRQITARTRAIFVSHLTSATALIFPVQDLCTAARQRGVLTVIDGAHAPGQLPLDLDAIGADFYTGNLHKWMCGPKGSAFLHVRREHHDLLQPPVVSWGLVAEQVQSPCGAEGSTAFDPYTGTSVLQRRLQWWGTRDLSAWLSLPAVIAFHQRHLGPDVRARCHERAIDTLHRLRARWGLRAIAHDHHHAQMVPIPVPHADGQALRQRLYEESQIEVAVTQHQDQTFVRLSVQGYTREEELSALMTAPALLP